jgi:tetratricopeptide (TPR) repeat protein
MGGKPSRAGQYFFIPVALLILQASCTLIHEAPERSKPIPPPLIVGEPKVITEPREVRDRREANEYLQVAQNLLARGDFDASLRECQKVLLLMKDRTPADAAVFQMGLVYAHPKNPKKDNKRAIGFFNQVIKAYPESPWIEQSKIWVGVLDGVERLKQVDIDIEGKKRDRSR